jgi:hypothetical protein
VVSHVGYISIQYSAWVAGAGCILRLCILRNYSRWVLGRRGAVHRSTHSVVATVPELEPLLTPRAGRRQRRRSAQSHVEQPRGDLPRIENSLHVPLRQRDDGYVASIQPSQSNSIRSDSESSDARSMYPATYASLTHTAAWGHARSLSWLAGIISCCTLFVRAGNKYF